MLDDANSVDVFPAEHSPPGLRAVIEHQSLLLILTQVGHGDIQHLGSGTHGYNGIGGFNAAGLRILFVELFFNILYCQVCFP